MIEVRDIQALLCDIDSERRADLGEGQNASYIPELANVDPELFSISLTGIDGRTCSAGDCDALLSMQSMSKVATLAFALERFGPDEIFKRVGMEPCAEPFNSIMKLEIASNIPLNPFINSGAILIASLLFERYGDEAIDGVLDFASALASKQLAVNERIYLSEAGTADRNRALVYFMRSAGSITTDAEKALSLYFRCCSIEADTRDLSVVGAVIANGGQNPITGERVISLETARILIGLMSTCGLYNESGEFAVKVGVPGKSGVSGGILCAVPGRMGIAVFSPRLDERGNSIAGIRALIRLSRELKLMGI